MRIELFYKTPGSAIEHPNISAHRVEVPLVAPDDSQYKIILLDADDSFDVIIHHPNGDREAIWSLVKGPQE